MDQENLYFNLISHLSIYRLRSIKKGYRLKNTKLWTKKSDNYYQYLIYNNFILCYHSLF